MNTHLKHSNGGTLCGPTLDEAYALDEDVTAYASVADCDECWREYEARAGIPTLNEIRRDLEYRTR